jgi:hypothetical protein
MSMFPVTWVCRSTKQASGVGSDSTFGSCGAIAGKLYSSRMRWLVPTASRPISPASPIVRPKPTKCTLSDSPAERRTMSLPASYVEMSTEMRFCASSGPRFGDAVTLRLSIAGCSPVGGGSKPLEGVSWIGVDMVSAVVELEGESPR